MIDKTSTINTPIDITFGHNCPMRKTTKFERVVTAYKDKGMTHTQTAIAADLGIAQSAVAAWKAGGHLKPGHILAICERTGVCPNWLQMDMAPQYPATPDVVALIDKLNALEPKDRERLLRVLEVLSID